MGSFLYLSIILLFTKKEKKDLSISLIKDYEHKALTSQA